MTTGQTGHVDPENATAIAAAGGQAAGDAAEQGQTSDQATVATQEAMSAEAAKRGVAISEADIQKIAAGTIAMLEARGAFEGAPATGQPSTPTSEPAATAVASGEGSAAPPANTSSSVPSGSTSSGEGEAAPRKRTFAERFQGKA